MSLGICLYYWRTLWHDWCTTLRHDWGTPGCMSVPLKTPLTRSMHSWVHVRTITKDQEYALQLKEHFDMINALLGTCLHHRRTLQHDWGTPGYMCVPLTPIYNTIFACMAVLPLPFVCSIDSEHNKMVSSIKEKIDKTKGEYNICVIKSKFTNSSSYPCLHVSCITCQQWL